jgi:co-chaperonin GroES (HSP10)
MKALADFVVVMQGEKATERKGILLPDVAREQSNRAEVVAIGPKVTTIAVGDTVLIPLLTLMRINSTHVCDLMIDDRPALVLKEEDIAVVWPKGM